MTQVYVVVDQDENGENVSVFTNLSDARVVAKEAVWDVLGPRETDKYKEACKAIDELAEFGGFYEYDDGKFVNIYHASLDS